MSEIRIINAVSDDTQNPFDGNEATRTVTSVINEVVEESKSSSDDLNTINSVVEGEPTGSIVVPNVVALTQAEYDVAVAASTIVPTTFYIING